MVSRGGKLDLTTSGCESDKNQKLGCVAGDDKIGTITKTYYGPGYGAGVWENPSSSGDFKSHTQYVILIPRLIILTAE